MKKPKSSAAKLLHRATAKLMLAQYHYGSGAHVKHTIKAIKEVAGLLVEARILLQDGRK